MKLLNEILEFELINLGDFHIRIYNIVVVLVLILSAFVLLKIIKKALFRKQKQNVIDTGTTYAIYQIIKYFIWVITIVFILDALGIKVTILLAGSAALMVGVGLGLQQTFNDIVSGIILLSERSIKVDDVLEVDGDVVKMQSIGLRTSAALNRDAISIIIPNSLITTNKVINWSHQDEVTRFKVEVGVAYGSDVDKVIRILEESGLDHQEVYQKNNIEARLVNFGNSSMDFELLFYSENIFGIEKVKSDLRRIINKKFIENNVVIPFPQLDLHVKSDGRMK
ncbi:MAG: mechanosensitive ion channel [Vicingaceae bacterium]